MAVADNDALGGCLFCDDFDDGVFSNIAWTFSPAGNAWIEAAGKLNETGTRSATAVASPVFGGCRLCAIDTSFQTSGGATSHVSLIGWYLDDRNYVELLIRERDDLWVLRQYANGTITAKVRAKRAILPDHPYAVRMSFDGTRISVAVDGAALLNMVPGSPPPVGTVGFDLKGTTASFDYVRVN